MNRRLLSIYLADHLAAATALERVARRTADSNRDNPYGAALDGLAHELGEERELLWAVMQSLGIQRPSAKVLAANALERLGRLKLNGRLLTLTYSPLSRVLEIEGLLVGTQASVATWRAIASLVDDEPALRAYDVPTRVGRALRRIELLEPLRARAFAEAIAG